MVQNIIIGTPLVRPELLIATDINDWENNEKPQTLFTEERSLPAILKEAGIVPSISEVRRNRPELMVQLETPDCFWVKWGKKRVYIVVGE